MLLPLLFNIVLEGLVRPVREKNKVKKGIKIGRKQVKLTLFTGDIIS
jgi:hypothetical protein